MTVRRIKILMIGVLVPMWMVAQTIVVDEGFESGVIPSTWTQEYGLRNQTVAVAAPQCPWRVERGDTSAYPVGAAQGMYRAFFRNTTSQTQGYITRLILPQMDLTDLNEPILRFSYAQTKWRTDIDTLRVLYRRDSKDNWRVLQTLAQTQPVWKRLELRLPSISATYQIAFEAIDNLGRGIVIDSIQVRELPQCTTPYNLIVSEISGGEATINWNADYDAIGFRVVVDSTREFNVAAEPWNLHVDNLAIGTHTVQVQALCAGENSAMSAVKTFEMPIERPLPYNYNFNDCPKSTVAWWPEGWHFGNNAGMDAFVTNNDAENRLDRVSADKTPALLFCMDNFYIRSIPANNYQYATTPALTGAPLNTCRVSFSAGVYEFNGANYAHSIIVGVMTDALDITTFVPVDTVSVTLFESFQNCYVNLDTYKGNGKFVAFMSNFDKPNNFYIDNLSVKPHGSTEAPVNVHAIGHTDEIVVKWEGNSNLYGVELHSDEIEVVLKDIQGEDSIVPFDTILHNITGTTLTVGDMREWTRYTARVWAEDGDTSEWTNCRTSVPYTLPLSYDFTIRAGQMDTTHLVNDYYAPKGVQTFATGNSRPYCGSSNSGFTVYGRSGKGFGLDESTLGSRGSYEYWAVYPYMERLDTMRMLFYFNCGNALNADKSWLSVGVAEDPQDMDTYHEMLLCVGDATWQRYVIDLQDSPLQNGFVVMRWLSKRSDATCHGWVDDVWFGQRGECDMVKNIRVDESQLKHNQAVLLYTAADGATVKVRVSTSRNLSDAQIEAGSSCVFQTNTASGGSVTATGLYQGTTYYVYMQAVCTNSTTSLWSSPMEFTTPCAPLTLPYTDGFEDWNTSAGYRPECWYGLNANSTPQVVTGTSLAHSGSKYMTLYSRYQSDTASLVLPAIEEGIKNIRVRLYAMSKYDGAKLCFGVLSDAEDYTTYEELAVIAAKDKNYNLYELTFTDYKGNGSFLSIMSRTDSTDEKKWMIDDIEIVTLECIKPFDIQLQDRQANSLHTTWQGMSEEGWQVIVADAPINPANPDMSHVVKNEVAKEASYIASGLNAQTTYYFYYRPQCTGAEWADTTFMTACRSLELGKTYDFEDQTGYTKDYSIPESAHIECWTMMNNGSNDRSSSAVPFVYQNATYASSGQNCLYMKPQNGTDQYSWVSLPYVNVADMSLVTVAFNAMHNYTYDWMNIEVGVMTDPEDMSTFVLCQRITPTQTQTRYKVNLEKYTGTGQYVALRAAGSAYPIYVDDIMVTQAPCKNLHPTIEEVTFQAVTVKTNFDYNTKWKVELTGEDGSSKDTAVWLAKQVTIMGLQPHVVYTMRSASICSITGTDTIFGDWDEQTFMTECAEVMVDDIELEDFEGMKARENYKDPYYDIPCWHVGNQLSTTSFPYVITQETKDLPRSGYGENQKLNGAHSGTNSLVFVTGSSSDGAWAAMPKLAQEEDITKVQVTFWAKGTQYFGSNKLAIGITTNLNDWGSFMPIDTIEAGYDGYTKYVVRFDTYRGDWDGRYGRYVTFASQFEDDNMIFIDDVKLSHIPTCAEPTNVRTVEIGDTQTSIAWDGNAAQYRVMVCDSAIAEEDWENYTEYLYNDTIESRNYQVNTPSLKHYYVYVKAVCEGEEGSWNIKGVDFAPLCGAKWQVPDVQTFDKSTYLPDCWQVIGTYANNTVKINTNGGHSGSNAVEMHNYAYSGTTATGLVLPLLSLEPGDCTIKFWANKGQQTTNTICLALLSEPTITVDSLKTISPLYQQTVLGNTWQEISFDISKLESEQLEGKPYIVLYTKTSNNNYNLLLDDIELIQMPACRAPRKLTATAGANEVQVTITPFRSYNSEWEVAVTDTLTKTQTITQTKTKTTTISGLTTDHIYALTARTVCGEGEQSEWGDTIYFHTIVAPTGLVAQPTDTTVVLTWDRHEPTQWNVYVSTTFILPSEVESKIDQFIKIEKNIADTFFVFQAEENTKYYFLLQSADMGSGKDTYVYTSATTLSHVYTPTNLQITAVSDSSVSVSWQDKSVMSNAIQISTNAEFTSLVVDTLVTNVQTFSYTPLEENTVYYIRVAQVNGTWPQSEWASISFTTRCGLVGIPFEYDFEESDLPRCWRTISRRSGYPKANTSYHTSGNQSWDFFATSADHCPQAIVLPGLDANLTECVLRFKARCYNASGSNYGDAVLYVALTDDPTKLTVENIASQYTVDSIPIAGKNFIQYETDLTTLSPQAIIGKSYIIIYLNAKGRVFMDELIVKESDICRKPMQLRVVETTGHTATLTFDQAKPSGNWTYAVCSDAAMTDTIAQGSTTSQTFTVKGLKQSTTYYASVRQVCDAENISDASEVSAFTTMLAPYYEELFHTDTVPGDWTKTSGIADSIFAGQPFEDYLNNWKIQDNNIAIAGKHMGYWFNSNWHKSWLLSPRISLDESDSTILSFDVAITCHDNQMPFEFEHQIDLLCVISTDGGKTWKRENATPITGLSTNADRRAISLTPYAGQVIQIGFYAGLKKFDEIVSADYHLGNVRINYYETRTSEITVCEFEDIIFEEEGIFIEGGTYPPGDHSDSVLIPAADPQGGLNKDVMEKYTAHILPSPEEEIYDVMCDGDSYTGYGFTNLVNAGTYRRKLTAQNGCDSLLTLHLSRKPSSHTYLNDTIEQGQSYTMLGKEYTQSGIYTDTTVAANLCDSIVTLALYVKGSKTTEFNAVTCEGTPYVWNDVDYWYEGDFYQLLQAQSGADSIVIMHLKVNPLKWDTIFDTFAPGTTYNKYDFMESKPGEYRHTYPSLITGCDSTTVLYLMIQSGLEEYYYQQQKVKKILDNEHVIIIRNGKRYGLLGEIQ